MRPSQLYARTPESVNHDIGSLIGPYYNYVPAIETSDPPWEDPNKRVEFRCYKYFNFDGRRFWKLAGIYFDGEPVMIIQNAGRESDDHRKRFITDFDRYQKMVAYFMSLMMPDDYRRQEIVGIDDEVEGLDDFYGNSLDGHFECYRD